MIQSWLAEKVGRFASALLIVLVFNVVMALAAWAFWRDGWQARDQQAINDQAELRVQRLQYLVQLTEHRNRIAGDYVLRRAQGEVIYRTIRTEIPRYVTVYKPTLAAPAEPLPRCVFTRGFVGLWNDALAGRSSTAASTTGTAAAAAAADPAADAELLDSGITQQALLENHVANGEVTFDNRTQCEALIDFYTKAPPGGSDGN